MFAILLLGLLVALRVKVELIGAGILAISGIKYLRGSSSEVLHTVALLILTKIGL